MFIMPDEDIELKCRVRNEYLKFDHKELLSPWNIRATSNKRFLQLVLMKFALDIKSYKFSVVRQKLLISEIDDYIKEYIFHGRETMRFKINYEYYEYVSAWLEDFGYDMEDKKVMTFILEKAIWNFMIEINSRPKKMTHSLNQGSCY